MIKIVCDDDKEDDRDDDVDDDDDDDDDDDLEIHEIKFMYWKASVHSMERHLKTPPKNWIHLF